MPSEPFPQSPPPGQPLLAPGGMPIHRYPKVICESQFYPVPARTDRARLGCGLSHLPWRALGAPERALARLGRDLGAT